VVRTRQVRTALYHGPAWGNPYHRRRVLGVVPLHPPRLPLLPVSILGSSLLLGLSPGLPVGRALPPSFEAQAATTPWKVFLADSRVDTLDAPRDLVLPEARRALEDDHWRVSSESTPSRLITDWKPMHHALVRFAMGEIQARCIVDVESLGSERTVVTFKAGLAGSKDLEGNPALSLARSAYHSAARDWVQAVREGIARRRKADLISTTGKPNSSSR
jgi:hypothetical protein